MIALTPVAAVVVDIVVWAVAGTAIGFGAHRIRAERFASDSWLTRLRPFEQDGRWYEQHLRMKAWKSRLPEAGALFRDGFSKRSLADGSPAHLIRFVRETRRAELTHWTLLGIAPLFALWNPWGLTLVMWGYAVVANVPFLLIQRYNRARLLRVLARAGRHAARPRAVSPADPA